MLKCRTLRRPCSTMKKQYRRWKVSVGTVKKSKAAITSRWSARKASQRLAGSPRRRKRRRYLATVRADWRLGGAAAIDLDRQQCEAAGRQIDRIQKQLHRIDEEILPEKKPHVEPSATHHDSGTTGAGSEQTGDRAGAGDLPRGGTQSPALELHHSAGVAASGESRASPATDPGALRQVQAESRASP